MKVRTRSLLILAATTLVFLISLGIIAQFVILDSFTTIEKNEMHANVQRVIANINTQEASVAASCKDWAQRDETYTFVTRANLSPGSSTLNPPVLLSTLDIDYLLVYDANGTLFFSQGARQLDMNEDPVPGKLDTIVKNSILPKGVPGGVSGRRGMSLINGVPVILSGYSIHGENESDPSRGTFVMARLLTTRKLEDMESVLQIPDISIRSLDYPGTAAVFSDDDLQKLKKGAIVSEPVSSDSLSGITVITGIEDKPTFLLLEVMTGRSIHNQVLSSIMIVAASVIFLSIIFITAVHLLLQRFALRPLSALDQDIKHITSSGDLSLRMPEKGDDEIRSLAGSLNRMLKELKENRDAIFKTRLELASRNRELEELNRKANLYLDIYLDVLTYEILNTIMGLRGYAEYLRDSANEMEKHFLDKIVRLAQKSSDVIRNVETISRIYKTPVQLKPVSLQYVLLQECSNRPSACIAIQDCDYPVISDDLLGVVFDNLFSNSLKFGGPNVHITVTSLKQDTMLEVTVSDDGPGIPDALKPLVFDRFSHDSKTRSSYGLGLSIVRMLIEGYGGKIRACDRLPGEILSGTAIRFTLRLAEAVREGS
jgi:signal transduction histidine kinase